MHSKRTGSHREHGAEGDDLVEPKKITGKDLNEIEELSARLTTLVEKDGRHASSRDFQGLRLRRAR
jgi:hypothetical protein